MAAKMRYCEKCGNTRVNWETGEPCDCVVDMESIFNSVSCLEVPEQYRGIAFSKALVPTDVPADYADYLEDLHNKILSGHLPKKNIFLASPIAHSKTIFAYSCIEVLFRSGIPIFPIFDVLEVVRILADMDLGRKQTYEVEFPEKLVTVPLLFVKIPRMLRWEVFDAVAMLLDRRVRRGNSTIYLYDGSWSNIVSADKNEITTGLVGDGNYTSLLVKSWSLLRSKVELQEQANIGYK